MQIGLGILGKIKVDDNVHGLDVDTAREEIATDQIAALAIPEVMKHLVAGWQMTMGQP